MFCKNCGAEIKEGATFCGNCGQNVNGQVQQPAEYNAPGAVSQPVVYNTAGSNQYQPVRSAPNYLAFSIIVTILCCLPLGIPAIVYAAQANSKLAVGDMAGAMDSASKSKMFCWISFGLGIAAYVIWFFFVFFSAMANLY